MPGEPIDYLGELRSGRAPDFSLLVTELHTTLLATGLTIAVAESCTGGLLGAALTELSGSSSYFLGGVLAYNDSVKLAVLGVSDETLFRHGAVSEATSGEMASGVRRLLASDLAVSVTGIAGPTGATIDKPLGTTFLGLAYVGTLRTFHFIWSGDRAENRRLSTMAGLAVILRGARAIGEKGFV